MTIKYSSNDKLTEEDKISFKKLVEEIADISEMERDIPTDMNDIYQSQTSIKIPKPQK